MIAEADLECVEKPCIDTLFRDFTVYRGERGALVLADARDALKKIPTASVDAIITDPPWGVGFDKYDDFNAFLDVRDELYRVLKDDGWLVFFFTPRRIYDITSYLERFRYRWIIPYIFTGFGAETRNPLGSQAAYSIIMVFSKGKPKIYVKKRDIIYADELPILERNVREPQFKPTFTVATLITMFSKEGDVILDPFAGYGSVPLICELYDRNWIAIEIDKVKYEIAKKIISNRKVLDIKRLKKEFEICQKEDYYRRGSNRGRRDRR
jgi:DNA modification methylase